LRPLLAVGLALLWWLVIAFLGGHPALADSSDYSQTLDPDVAAAQPAASPGPSFSMFELSEIPWRVLTTDEELAVAVALGPAPKLEPKKAFRKRSNDLFRTDRPVEIGNRQMVLRVRLRAKSRETMSVELRF
jgi:hypothetical protein